MGLFGSTFRQGGHLGGEVLSKSLEDIIREEAQRRLLEQQQAAGPIQMGGNFQQRFGDQGAPIPQLAQQAVQEQAMQAPPPEPAQDPRELARMEYINREAKALSQPERRGSGFGRFLGEMVRRLPAAAAAANGDHATAMRYNMMLNERRGEQREAQEAQTAQRNLQLNAVKAGMTPMEASMAVLNPQALGAEFNTRFRTREASEGQGIVTPGFDGSRSVYTQPKHIEQGSGIIRVGGEAEPQRVYQGPTPAVENALAIGLQPGTPGFDTFVRDFTLNGQGPTGTETTRRGQDINRQNALDGIGDRQQRHANPVARPANPGNSEGSLYTDIMRRWSQGGQVNDREREFVRSYEQRRASRGRGTGRPGRSGGGSSANAATAVGPNGQRIYFRGGRWVDEQGRPVG